MFRTEEEKKKVYEAIKNNVRITDYAQMIGYTLIPRGGRYFSLKEHDSVMIDTQKNCFWRNSGIGQNNKGSVIDFCMHFQNKTIHEALEELEPMANIGDLSNYSYNASSKKHIEEHRNNSLMYEDEKLVDGIKVRICGLPRRVLMGKEVTQTGTLEFKNDEYLVLQDSHENTWEFNKEDIQGIEEYGVTLPEAAPNMRRAYAYLTQTRHIAQEVVQKFVDKKMLFQDVNGNCVFVSYDKDGQAVFANKRGTLSEKRYVQDVAGCDYAHGFYIDNGANKLIVSESTIDAMSVMSILNAQGKGIENYNYLALSGTGKYEAVKNHITAEIEEIMVAADNDKAGRKLVRNLQAEFGDMAIPYLPRHAKDWNQELTDVSLRLGNIADIKFEQVKNMLSNIRLAEFQETALCMKEKITKHEELYEDNPENRESAKRFVKLSKEKYNDRFLTAYALAKTLESGSEENYFKRVILNATKIYDGNVQLNENIELPDSIKEKIQDFAKIGNSVVRFDDFRTENGKTIASIRYNGMDMEVPVMAMNNELFVRTGDKTQGTLEQHFLSKIDLQHFKEFKESIGKEKSFVKEMCAKEGERQQFTMSHLQPKMQMEM